MFRLNCRICDRWQCTMRGSHLLLLVRVARGQASQWPIGVACWQFGTIDARSRRREHCDSVLRMLQLQLVAFPGCHSDNSFRSADATMNDPAWADAYMRQWVWLSRTTSSQCVAPHHVDTTSRKEAASAPSHNQTANTPLCRGGPRMILMMW